MNTCEACGVTSAAVVPYKRVDGRTALGCPSTDVGCYERWLVTAKAWRARSSRALGGVAVSSEGTQENQK